jgi:hypothetical protein
MSGAGKAASSSSREATTVTFNSSARSTVLPTKVYSFRQSENACAWSLASKTKQSLLEAADWQHLEGIVSKLTLQVG